MSTPSTPDSAEAYARAYAAHYTTKNYQQAVFGYAALVEQHPGTPEADHARAQVLNLLASLVSVDRVFATHLSLILKEIEDRESPRPDR